MEKKQTGSESAFEPMTVILLRRKVERDGRVSLDWDFGWPADCLNREGTAQFVKSLDQETDRYTGTGERNEGTNAKGNWQRKTTGDRAGSWSERAIPS